MNKRELSKFNTLSKKNKILTTINYTWSILFSLTLIGFLISMIFLGDPYNRLLSCVGTLACYMAPLLIQLIFKIRISPSLYTFYLVYVTLAGFCGSCLYMYKSIPFTDKVVHTVWGYIACLIGLYLICRTKEISNLKPITIVFIFLGVSMATASVWEVVEFASDHLLNQTSQGIPVEGIVSVTDTMTDIICHLAGSIVFTIHYLIDRLTHKNIGITSIINDFMTDY